MAIARRQHSLVPVDEKVPESKFRPDVDRVLREQAATIAALSARVLELEEASGSGAPVAASYVTIASDATLTAERTLAAGSGITVTDGGANSSVTIAATATDEHIQDVVGALVTDTTTIAWTYNDGADTLSAAVVTEGIQDLVGAMGANGTNTTFAYNDAAGTMAWSIADATIQELARDAVGAAIVDGHAIDTTVNDGADTITIAVDETEFATGPGLITAAMLDNGAARSVLARAANSSGARADISGVAHGLLHDDGSTLAFRTFNAIAEAEPFYDVDFSTLANNTLTAGTEIIDGLSWTVAGDTFLNTFDILNGTGLRMIAGNSLGTHSTWTSATQDAPYLYLPLSSIPNWNGVSDIIVDLYIPTLTLENANEYVFAAFWNIAAEPHSTSVARVRKFTWIASGGNVIPSVTIDAGQTNGTETRAGQNVLSLRLAPNGHCHCSWGTWSAGWPVRMSGTMTMTSSVSQINPLLRDSTRLVIGMGVLNDASATTQSVVQRMRVRRAG